ncbi:hypothetical protein MNBD_ALPHA04-2051 [hydrothermal vent metagenome]|uniref:DUF11 domain-containing protein n=1 Tax=hydrothermal vent metagenome TaxID=652676 RepID=A0A3B0TAZ3_9ZZZZ
MSKRTILIETALVIGVLTTGIAAANAAHAMPVFATVQTAKAVDQRAYVKIESTIKIERTEINDDGTKVVKLMTPNDVKVVPGDNLVFVNAYRNTGSAAVTGFVVNNPVHSAVSFTGVSENWALVSVDGGKTFGKLAELTITDPDDQTSDTQNTSPATGSRAAQLADVTHIRWIFAKPIAAGESGELTFRGIVK